MRSPGRAVIASAFVVPTAEQREHRRDPFEGLVEAVDPVLELARVGRCRIGVVRLV
jgi:hypothetical protein